MRDRRRVDELSIEELEQVLAMRKREARMKRLERMKRTGRVVENQPVKQAARPAPKPAQVPKQDRHLDDIIAHIANNPADPNAVVRFVEEEPAPTVTHPNGADAEVPVPQTQQPPKPSKKRFSQAARRLTNNLLLLVEVAAVLGLVYLGWELLQGIQILESRTTEAQTELEAVRAASVPTLAPTPVLQLNQVVLPGGHKFIEGQTPSLNIEEIPENVRFAVADQITRPVINRPEKTSQTALRLTIPKLNIDQTIVQGADWEALKQGVGQVINGYNPGDETGNIALTAHNDIYGELFKDIDQLAPGDQFQVQTEEEVYLYEITHTDIVAPTDVHVLQSVGKPTAVLISCYPYRVNTQRIVVFADRIG